MSVFSGWSHTARATFWPVTLDEYQQPTYGTAVVYDCSYQIGGRLSNDQTGAEFMPSTSIWIEAELVDAPKYGWVCAVGEYSGSPPAGAETVRLVRTWDDTTFGRTTPDVMVLTG